MSKKIPMFAVSEPYIPIFRDLLMVDDLVDDPIGAIYHRDISMRSHVVGKTIPASVISHEEFAVPPVTLATLNKISKDDIKKCQYNLIERVEARSHNSLRWLEDVEIFKLLNAAVPTNQRIAAGNLVPENFTLGFAMLERHNLSPAAILVHPFTFAKMRDFGHKKFKEKPKPNHKHKATFYKVPVYSVATCPQNAVYILAAPEYVGVLVIPKDVEKTTFEEPDKQRWCCTMTQEIGLCVANEYAIVNIVA